MRSLLSAGVSLYAAAAAAAASSSADVFLGIFLAAKRSHRSHWTCWHVILLPLFGNDPHPPDQLRWTSPAAFGGYIPSCSLDWLKNLQVYPP